MSWLKKLTSGLSKTSARVTSSLSSLLGRSSSDAASIEEVEDALISADLGTAAAARACTSVDGHRGGATGERHLAAAAAAKIVYSCSCLAAAQEDMNVEVVQHV